MRTIVASDRYVNMRIDKVIREAFPRMPVSAMHKAFRKKDVKVNGIRIKDDYVINPGDRIDVYIVDEILDGVPQESGFKLNRGFSVVFEDANILVVNKEQGIPVHPDREQADNTLIDLVHTYLAEKGEFNPAHRDAFVPALCHRLDRNTGGLVIIAKNEESLTAMLEKMRNNEVRKFYQCLVKGRMEKLQDELRDYLVKDERKSRVFISSDRPKGGLEIITRYKVLSYDKETDVSRLEVELLTGRTHQIRAHLAYIGHPVIGDGKYGTNEINRAYKVKHQALWAYKLVFDFKGGRSLDYLKGKKIEVEPEFDPLREARG